MEVLLSFRQEKVLPGHVGGLAMGVERFLVVS